MPRLAALLLSALAALVAGGTSCLPWQSPVLSSTSTANPASEPKPWVKGWEKVDPKEDCRFEREGDQLTITVPGKGHILQDLTAPRLLREVEGDFAVEVRMNGGCWPKKKKGGHKNIRRAGIVAMGDKTYAAVWKCRGDPSDEGSWYFWAEVWPGSRAEEKVLRCHGDDGYLFQQFTYLRLERRKDEWRWIYSYDRKNWYFHYKDEVKLPLKLKVGVFAEADSDSPFEVTFDQFRLAQPGKSVPAKRPTLED